MATKTTRATRPKATPLSKVLVRYKKKQMAERVKRDPRIVTVRYYDDGWVSNSYRYAAPGTGTEYSANGKATFTYDRKRSGGKGPRWVAFSARGGRLASQ